MDKKASPTTLSAEQETLLAKFSAEYRGLLFKTKGRYDVARFERGIRYFLEKQYGSGDFKVEWLSSPKELKKIFDRLHYTTLTALGRSWGRPSYRLPIAIRRKLQTAFSSTRWPNSFISNTPGLNIYDGRNMESHDVSYIFTAKMAGEVVGQVRPKDMPSKREIEAYYDIVRSCSGFVHNDANKTVYVSENPVSVKLDDQNRLHNDSGPAIEYAGGYKIYAVHGVHIQDESIITHPEALTVGRIQRESNSEVQRVMMERFGLDRYLTETEARVVDHDDRWGTLYEIELSSNLGPWWQPARKDYFLVVTNRTAEPDGTFKKYTLAIHPQCRPLPNPADANASYGGVQKMNALNAVASTFGLRGEDYVNLLAAES